MVGACQTTAAGGRPPSFGRLTGRAIFPFEDSAQHLDNGEALFHSSHLNRSMEGLGEIKR
jgi:hypothetical protein